MIIIGKGGHAGAVAASVKRYGPGVDIIFTDESEPLEKWHEHSCFIAIGNNMARERISKLRLDFNFSIWDKSALGSFEILDSMGNYFGPNSFVGNNSKVGNFCIINTFSVLEHDSILGDFSHLASGVVAGGNVKIGKRTLIGTNATIRAGITIGDDVVVGCGSVVVKDIPSNQVWFGNPAKHQWGNK